MIRIFLAENAPTAMYPEAKHTLQLFHQGNHVRQMYVDTHRTVCNATPSSNKFLFVKESSVAYTILGMYAWYKGKINILKFPP